MLNIAFESIPVDVVVMKNRLYNDIYIVNENLKTSKKNEIIDKIKGNKYESSNIR